MQGPRAGRSKPRRENVAQRDSNIAQQRLLIASPIVQRHVVVDSLVYCPVDVAFSLLTLFTSCVVLLCRFQ